MFLDKLMHISIEFMTVIGLYGLCFYIRNYLNWFDKKLEELSEYDKTSTIVGYLLILYHIFVVCIIWFIFFGFNRIF